MANFNPYDTTPFVTNRQYNSCMV